jgi:hypothetical protein
MQYDIIQRAYIEHLHGYYVTCQWLELLAAEQDSLSEASTGCQR